MHLSFALQAHKKRRLRKRCIIPVFIIVHLYKDWGDLDVTANCGFLSCEWALGISAMHINLPTHSSPPPPFIYDALPFFFSQWTIVSHSVGTGQIILYTNHKMANCGLLSEEINRGGEATCKLRREGGWERKGCMRAHLCGSKPQFARTAEPSQRGFILSSLSVITVKCAKLREIINN